MARLTKRLAKSQGPTGFSQAQLEKARKNNEAYAANLTKAMEGLGRRVLADFSATVLDVAMRVTIVDSARFAANWKLAVNRDSYSTAWHPKKYKGQAEGGSYIGDEGDKKAGRDENNKRRILASKRLYYGYTRKRDGIVVNPDGMLASKIGLGGVVGRPAKGSRRTKGPQLGALPRVELFNAIMAKGAKQYIERALTEKTGAVQEIGKQARAEFGTGKIQEIIAYTRAQMK